MAKDKFIQGMHMKKGALSAEAKKAGKSLDEFCAESGHSSRTQKRCSLRKTLMGMNK